MCDPAQQTVALIGLGTIGLSSAALHLKYAGANVRLYDTRPDIEQHVASLLPVYLKTENTNIGELSILELLSTGRLKICSSIKDVCAGATIVQEQGPENLDFKKATWAEVLKFAGSDTHLWSSTSGILASKQVEDLEDKSRVLIVHPFNPPHITPLIEIIPSPFTRNGEAQFAQSYFDRLNAGYRPVLVKKEVIGFVGNRLAFALFREACHLVSNDVVSVEDVDNVVEASFGPRWAVAGPFKLWNFGGGLGGLGSFIDNLGGTMEDCWNDAGVISLKGTRPASYDADQSNDVDEEFHQEWPRKVARQTQMAYGFPTAETMAQRDIDLQKVIDAQPKTSIHK